MSSHFSLASAGLLSSTEKKSKRCRDDRWEKNPLEIELGRQIRSCFTEPRSMVLKTRPIFWTPSKCSLQKSYYTFGYRLERRRTWNHSGLLHILVHDMVKIFIPKCLAVPTGEQPRLILLLHVLKIYTMPRMQNNTDHSPLTQQYWILTFPCLLINQ